jgi:uncharacterized protein with NAD-binding domain and iron-sulfur cluster
MLFEGDRVSRVELHEGQELSADWYVLALPLRDLRPLLPESVLARYAYFEQLTRLACSPALSVHLWMDRAITAPRLILLEGSRYHWLLARAAGESETGRAVMAVTATGKSELWEQPEAALVESALRTCQESCPSLAGAGILSHVILREPDAFLTVHPGAAALRPLPRSPIHNLLLAGAWTDTGLPATLESAVLSGTRCADAIQSAIHSAR